jgi:hypothetical protein
LDDNIENDEMDRAVTLGAGQRNEYEMDRAVTLRAGQRN